MSIDDHNFIIYTKVPRNDDIAEYKKYITEEFLPELLRITNYPKIKTMRFEKYEPDYTSWRGIAYGTISYGTISYRIETEPKKDFYITSENGLVLHISP